MKSFEIAVCICIVALLLAGCAGQRRVRPAQPDSVPYPTAQQPIVFHPTPKGLEILFVGPSGSVGKRVLVGPDAAYAVSPNFRRAALVSFDPQTEARWVTFYDRTGNVTANVLLPPLPEAAERLSYHGREIAITDEPQALVQFHHEPFTHTAPTAAEKAMRITERFFVDPKGKVVSVPTAGCFAGAVPAPGGAELSLLFIYPIPIPRVARFSSGFALLWGRHDPHDAVTNWTLERYDTNFSLRWKKEIKTHSARLTAPKYDVSVESYGEDGAWRRLYHYKAEGSVEVETFPPPSLP